MPCFSREGKIYFFFVKRMVFFAISKGVLMASIYIAVNTCWGAIADPSRIHHECLVDIYCKTEKKRRVAARKN